MLKSIQMRLSSLGLKQVRRAVVFVVGMTVLLLGVALIVLPGPAIVVIPMGLAILGLEFRWARRWMQRARAMIQSGHDHMFQSNRSAPSSNAAKPCPHQNPPGRDVKLSGCRMREKEAVMD
jgi:uncharacterized protein (TIGR02611 family)